MATEIDHLIYFVSDLSQGMDKIEKLFGVRPVVGGRHPDYGTHNALLSLGDSTYLEIMAHDPDLEPPERGKLFGPEGSGDGRLIAWILATDNISSERERCVAEGLEMGEVLSGSRVRSDGSIISWTLTDPYAITPPSCIPFMINWGNTPHPGLSSPRAGVLKELSFGHPDPEVVQAKLGVLGADLRVSFSDEPKIVARLETARGEVVLT